MNANTTNVANRKMTLKRIANSASVAVKEKQDRQEIIKHQTKFLEDYERYIRPILEMPSGAHPVNPEKLEDWINSQQSQTRREVAQALSEHIVYITHQEVIDHCKDLVNQFYTKYLPQQGLESPTIILFTHRRGKSGYMIALLFYYWAQQLGFPLPKMMVNELYPHLIKDPNCVFAYIDDMSYSGSQISQILSKFAIVPSYIEKSAYPKFWIGFVAITQHAMEHLATIAPFEEASLRQNQVQNIVGKNPNIALHNIRPQRNRIYGMKHIRVQNPFVVYASRVIPSLRAQLGDELYIAACIFFGYNNPDCILYFDHKVADIPSTFMKVLVFGPVPAVDAIYPSNSTGNNNDEDTYYTLWSSDADLMNIQVYDRGRDGTSHVTQFKPFIEGCPGLSEATKVLWGNVPYAEFLSGEKWTNGPWPVSLDSFDATEIRCPHSWYKTMFVGGKRKTNRTKKSKRRSLRRK